MGTPLEVTLGAVLLRLKFRLAVAESCTGGLVAHRITNVPGSSVYFVGGVIAYDNEVKLKQLGVRLETIIQYGAVSEACVVEMARGARHVMGAQLGLSVSGIAGPGGGTLEKPVGLVWIGLSTPRGDQAVRLLFSGDRFAIKEKATDAAMQALLDFLQQLYPDQVEYPAENISALVQSEPGEAPQVAYKPVEVSFRQDAAGKPSPRNFSYDGQVIQINSIGRRWEDALGEHILVMGADQRVFELLYAPLERAWYLSQPGAVRLKT